MVQYFLIDPGNAMPRWCQTHRKNDGSGFQWMDFKHRFIDLQTSAVLAVAEGETIDDAQKSVPEDIVKLEQDFASMYLLDPWSEQGWLSPTGKFYGCKYYNHDDIAYALLRTSPYGLEMSGWIRVHEDFYKTGGLRDRASRAQTRVLLDLGFINPPDDHRRIKGFKVDRSAPAPRYAVKPSASVMLNPIIAAHFKPKMEDLMTDVKNRLRQDDTLRALFDLYHEDVPDVGPGTWMWLFHWEDFDIGCPEEPSDILRYNGITLIKTSFSTLEIEACSEAGIHFADGAKELLESELHQMRRMAA
ncbi:hypothetical protein [Mesorhizobium sp. SP-1A]|uniref:hypothetical protein n=1 Tax=Mesorhizobium sp. SP-1A TaxID=3077840 RepID=UPI0028F73CB7|nr:hypothetical protein [Mesorhizobium sp. SP-1A]